MVQCTATSKRTGERCRAQAVTGMRTCRNHGGTAKVGIASPNFKTGRHSRHLPRGLHDAYAASLADPDLLRLGSELSLIDARIAALLDRLATGESRDAWNRLALAVDRVQAAINMDESLDAAMRELRALVARGCGDQVTWAEVMDCIDLRRKTAQAETRRLIAAQQMMPKDQAMGLMGRLIDIVLKHTPEIERRVAMQDEFRVVFASAAAVLAYEGDVGAEL